MMDCYTEPKPEDIKKQIMDIFEEIEEEMSKENVNNSKIVKLRTKQLMQGLYLQTIND